MSADNSDLNHPILNLSPDEKRAFAFLFACADKDQLGVVTGENAVSFFERTKVSPNVLGEIWQIADTENRGLLTRPGFSIVLRLIGHYQAGREPSNELAFKPGPIPTFEGLQIPGASGLGAAANSVPSPTSTAFAANALQPQSSGQGPIRVPPLDPQKVQQYSSLFERSGARGGILDGATAKSIFEKAGLPNETLGRIWGLADREQRGALDQTEFIIAMHLLTSMKSRAMLALPNTLPSGLYEAAARRGGPPPSRQGTTSAAVPRQLTGGSVGAIPRTQSPLARPAGFGTPPPGSAPWLITPADKAKFDQFFNNIDTQGRGIVGGEQAVAFFSDSRLPEDTLAQIWDLADINSEGHLTKEEFAVAMYLIRQQRAPNAPPLPAFLPVQLVPPSMRNQPQQTASTAPAFDNANNTSNMPKSAADDLFGLDEPPSSPPRTGPSFQTPLQPQGTGASATRDPFGASQPASPTSPQRFQPQPQQPSSIFKPFMPTSAFGASLAQQSTGGSLGSSTTGAAARAPPAAQPAALDDLLGDNDTHMEESNKLTTETTELANMSNQIGNLRNQMEQTQTKKGATQAEVNAVAAQKRDLETRLQQFRTQYEQEVRTVKELEQQLTTSRESTKKLSQELAMLEGTHQDLRTQHQTVAQALQADQQENASLKQRLAEINAEVAKLKPELEKMKLDARQQKGLASINKKQLTTTEGERDRLNAEKTSMESEATAREQDVASGTAFPEVEPTPPAAASNLASPASTLSATNPFFRKPGGEPVTDRSMSTPPKAGHGPTPSAFDALFGPSSHSRSGTPPVTSFGARNAAASPVPAGMSDSIQSFSSVGEHTPSETPPVSDGVKDSPSTFEPPPPPSAGQFTSAQLPVRQLSRSRDTETSSTFPIPPASRASEPRSATETPVPHVPGSFDDAEHVEHPNEPAATTNAKDDFDSAFAGFGDAEAAKDGELASAHADAPASGPSRGFHSEFPPIHSLEHDDDDDDDSDEDSDEEQRPSTSHATTLASSSAAPAAAVASTETAVGSPPPHEAQSSPPPYVDDGKPIHGGQGARADSYQFPNEFHGLLPSREDENTLEISPSNERTQPEVTTASAVETETDAQRTPPASTPVPTSAATATHDVFHDATSRPPSSVNEYEEPSQHPVPAVKNAFDDFDDFDNLAPAQEAGKSGLNDLDFGFGGSEAHNDFDSAFDSPAASMSTGMTSSQNTPVPATRALPSTSHEPSFSSFKPSSSGNAFSNNSSIQNTPQTASGQHDWDAIFSGLDSSKAPDTSLANDPWGSLNGSTAATAEPTSQKSLSTTSAATARPVGGGAITPGTEHDDPILKRLTGMGYPRAQALGALEHCDYDINRAVDHLNNS